MANYTPVWRDGQRLTAWMLHVIQLLNDDLRKAFGVSVIVTSAIRTYAEQERIFRERYVTAGNVNGRRVYDTRWWNGVLWYRISPAGTVAQPGTSNHEIQGDRAAVDIRDTGADAGITVASSARGRWIRDWCRRTGLLIASGDGFGEGWHFDVPGIFRTPPGSGGGSKPTPPTTNENEDEMRNSGVYYEKSKNTWVYLVFNTNSGWYHEFSNGANAGKMASTYNNAFATALNTTNWANVTASHAAVIKSSLDQVRKGA